MPKVEISEESAPGVRGCGSESLRELEHLLELIERGHVVKQNSESC